MRGRIEETRQNGGEQAAVDMTVRDEYNGPSFGNAARMTNHLGTNRTN